MNLLINVFVLCLVPELFFLQIQQDSAAKLIFTGDLSLAHAYEFTWNYRKIDVFANWKQIGSYDAMMVNLENPVTKSVDSIEKEYVFKMKPELLGQLVKAKVAIVNCANNHTADFGVEGIIETIRWLDSAGIKHVGAGRNFKDARKPIILEFSGVRIGFLGYGGVKEFIASRSMPGTNSRNENYILEDIKKLRPDVDAIVVNLHWGDELATEPNEGQISLAHRIIDGGADLIIGHHPHVLQGIEQYHGKVIAYSLGNFVFGGNAKSINSETAVLKASFTKENIIVQAIPVRIRNWQPEPADSITAQRVINQLQDRSKIFKETISFNK
jgi:poly-gamma-glutamate capsule biosynthesis protein CapA/YwtB (metallophosphatase superfamily)